MFTLFKSPGPAAKQPSLPTIDIQDHTTPNDDSLAQDVSIPPTSQPEPRTSDVSVPTSIDSSNTIQGSPADAPQPHTIPLPSSPIPTASLAPPSPAKVHISTYSVTSHSSGNGDSTMQTQSQTALPYSPAPTNSTTKDPRSFSLPSFAFLRSDAKQNKPRPPPLRIHPPSASRTLEKKSKASRSLFVLPVRASGMSEKRAMNSAMIVRSVIVGDHAIATGPTSNKKKSLSKSDVARVKTQLLQPKAASKVITQLRALPAHPNASATSNNIPIHAVCLDAPDRDFHEQHLAQFESIATAPLSAISAILADVHLIDLLTAPSMGFGAPVTAQGLFAGAVPTAETVIDGIEQITPQLLALGYATGKAIVPDHKGVTVPVDRISVLTYWWGFELCLPPPTMAFLEAAESPGSTLLDLLTALSVVNEGVREVLPFIRYIAQFIQSEWTSIKKADEGQGVVCTATWILPVALVARPWDFPEPPPSHSELVVAGQTTPTSPSVRRFSATLVTPKPSTEVPNMVHRTSSTYSAESGDEDDSRPMISSDPPVLPELVVSSPGSIDGAPPKDVDGDSFYAHDKVQHNGNGIAH